MKYLGVRVIAPLRLKLSVKPSAFTRSRKPPTL